MIDRELFRQITLFKNLDQWQGNLVLDLLKQSLIPAGAKIVEEGVVGQSLYIILSGKVRVSRMFDKETVVLTELKPYDFFGEMSLIDDFAASATVEAMTDTEVLHLSRDDFKALLRRSSELSSKIWESMARNLSMKIRNTDQLVKTYHGLNRALCENEEFRRLYTSWNFIQKD